MNLDCDLSKMGKKWVSCFDLLGFSNFVRKRGTIETFTLIRWCLGEADFFARLNKIDFVWFSDTFIFYTLDDSADSFCAIADTSYSFFDEAFLANLPLRGAMAFGEFYPDKANGVFLGKALVDAYSYGERFNWLGFVHHQSALDQMKHVGKSISPTYEREWNVPKKNQNDKESAVAYMIGSNGEWPTTGSNPYLKAIEEMGDAAQMDEIKYRNTAEFLRSTYGQP